MFLAAFLSFWFATPARAGTATSITGLYATGAGTGSRDGNWRMADGRRSYVVTGNVPSAWADNTSSARWISYSSDAQAYSSDAGPFTYTLTFNIAGTGTGTVNNVTITLALAVDDGATISVNGTNTGVTASGWASTSILTLNASNSNFVIGTNTITISVANTGLGATGLFVSSIAGVVPEVGAWLPLAVAFGVFGWFRLRRKKHALPAAV